MGIKRYRSIAGRRTRHSAAWTPSTTALLGHRLMFLNSTCSPLWPWPWPWPWPLLLLLLLLSGCHSPSSPSWSGRERAASRGPVWHVAVLVLAGAVTQFQSQTANCWSRGGGTPSGRLLGCQDARMHMHTDTDSMSGTLLCTPKLACTPPARPAYHTHAPRPQRQSSHRRIVASPRRHLACPSAARKPIAEDWIAPQGND